MGLIGSTDSGLFRKIKLYVFGVVLGGIISYFLLIRNRDLTYWTPERQVTGRLKMYALSYSDIAACRMRCNALDEKTLKSKLDSASVDFKNSSVDNKPCPIYSIYTRDGINIKALLCDDSTAKILELRGDLFRDDTCKCQ